MQTGKKRTVKKDAAESIADILMQQNEGLSTEERQKRLLALKGIAKDVRDQRSRFATPQPTVAKTPKVRIPA